MTWVVKKEGPDGAITKTEVSDFDQAVRMRNDFLAENLKAWVEDENGQLVGFQLLDRGAHDPYD